MSYYLIIFWGAFFAGESFLIPGVYLMLKGLISYKGYMFFGISATIISDSVWYYLGRIIPTGRIKRLAIIQKSLPKIEIIKNLFKEDGLKILIISKFVYGTRILTQMLCGKMKIPYFKYITVNSIAIFLWINIIFVLTYLTEKGLSISHITYSAEISIGLILILIIIIYKWIKKIIHKKWPQL